MEYIGIHERITLKCMLKIGYEDMDWFYLDQDAIQWILFLVLILASLIVLLYVYCLLTDILSVLGSRSL